MKKVLSLFLIAILAIASLSGCSLAKTGNDKKGTENASGGSETADTKPIRIVSTFEGTCQVQTQLAYLLGFYEQEGLVEGKDYEIIDTGGAQGSELMATDKADVAIGLIAGMLQPIENGLEIQAISGLHTGCVTLVTKGDSGINSVADLKGKTVGITALNSSQHITALRALRFEGLSGDDVEFVVYDKDAIQEALLNGAVDAIGLGDYKAKILERDEGAKIIFDNGTDPRLKDENCCVLWATKKAISSKSEKLAKLVNAIRKATLWIEKNPDLAAQIQEAQGYTLGEVSVNTELLKVYQFPTGSDELKESVDRNFKDAKILGLLKEETSGEELANNSFVILDGLNDDLKESDGEPPKDPNSFLEVKETSEAK